MTSTSVSPVKTEPAEIALNTRDDLRAFGTNARLLFVAELRLGIDDIEAFAADCLTDGNNDKKCDLVHVSRDLGRITVAQAVAVSSPSKGPSANKSSDLNTGVSWLLAGDINRLPEALKGAAIEARSALEDGSIQQFHIWGVHNRPHDANFETELAQVKQTAAALIKTHFPKAQVEVMSEQIGLEALANDYKSIQLPILVTETFDFRTLGGYEVSGSSWKAYCTAINATELRQAWSKHQTRLLSPNIRDYLGVRRSEQNINYGIKRSAVNEPGEFMVYNNGITALVHSFVPDPNGDGSNVIRVNGLGIVNGGQTTGSLGTLTDAEAGHLDAAWVQVRFVESQSQDIVQNVVQYNNTQNKVEAADFRSNDAVQARLRTEFQDIPDALYRGGRRGGTLDAIKRERNLLPDNTVVQALAAFHGDPNLAYNQTREIWINDAYYARLFNENTKAEHLLLCYSLFKAVEHAKLELARIPEEERIGSQKTHMSFFTGRGSIAVMTAAWGGCIETVLGRVVPNRFDLRFTGSSTPQQAIDNWKPIVSLGLAFAGRLKPAVDRGLQNKGNVEAAVMSFGEMIEATRSANAAVYDAFAAMVE